MAGVGGDPGDLGESGDIGIGGKGATDTDGNCDNKAEANRGRNGTQRIRKESEKSRLARSGNPGKAFSGVLAPLLVEESLDLFSLKEAVVEETYMFHFSRDYKILLQDTFRVLLNQDFSREKIQNIDPITASIILQANKQNLDDIVLSWQRHFIDKLKANKEFSVFTKAAAEIVSVLNRIKADEILTMELKNDIQKLQVEADKILRVRMKSLSLQCLRMNEALVLSRLGREFSVLQTPICKEEVVHSLLSNPKQDLKINIPREKEVDSREDLNDFIEVQSLEVNQARDIAQARNVIFLYNRTYGEMDIQRAVPKNGDRTKVAGLISFTVPSEEEVNVGSIRAHIQSLGLAGSIK